MTLGEALGFVNPGTLSVALVGGLATGLLYFRDRRAAAPYLIALYGIGLAFIVSLAVTRWVQDAATWDRWVGVGLLWSAHALAASAGSRLRIVLLHSRRGHDPEWRDR